MTETTAPPSAPSRFDLTEFEREIEAAVAKIDPLLPTCPGWCTHPHDTDDPSLAIDRAPDGQQQLTRFHRAVVGTMRPDVIDREQIADATAMTITVVEQMEHTTEDGMVTRCPLALVIYMEQGTDLTGADATNLAALLLAGADRIRDLS